MALACLDTLWPRLCPRVGQSNALQHAEADFADLRGGMSVKIVAARLAARCFD
jgi:hypothetical protein